MRTLLRIGELAAHAGVGPRTVDYYTQLGLINPAQRSDGGYRLYDVTAAGNITILNRVCKDNGSGWPLGAPRQLPGGVDRRPSAVNPCEPEGSWRK